MTSKGLLVSVVIPTYNSATYLPATLRSVAEQCYESCEVIVVDDGSTDETPQVLATMARTIPQLTFLRTSNSGGPARPRNIGIARATGSFVALFDSDDLMLPGKLSRSVQLMQANPTIGLVFTDFMKIDADGTRLSGRFLDGFGRLKESLVPTSTTGAYLVPQGVAYRGLIHGNYIGTSSVMFRRSLVDSIGSFDESLSVSEDRDLWFRVATHCDLGLIDEPMHLYRLRSGSIMHRRPRDLAPDRIRVLKRQLSPKLDREIRRKLRWWIAQNHIEWADDLRRGGAVMRACSEYMKAFRAYPELESLRGLALAAIGVLNGLVHRRAGGS